MEASMKAQVLAELELMVKEDKKLVTYKLLSRQFDISSNEAKDMLMEFSQNHSELQVIYLVSGWMKAKNAENEDNPSSETICPSYVIQLATMPNLEEAKAVLDPLHSVHVYSVQAALPKDAANIWNDEYVQSEAFFNAPREEDNCLRDNRFSAVSCPSIKRNPLGPTRRVALARAPAGPPPPPRAAVESKPAPAPPPSASGVVAAPGSGGAVDGKAKAAAGASTAAPSNPKPDAPGVKRKAPSFANTGKSLASLWGRAAAKPKPEVPLPEAPPAAAAPPTTRPAAPPAVPSVPPPAAAASAPTSGGAPAEDPLKKKSHTGTMAATPAEEEEEGDDDGAILRFMSGRGDGTVQRTSAAAVAVVATGRAAGGAGRAGRRKRQLVHEDEDDDDPFAEEAVLCGQKEKEAEVEREVAVAAGGVSGSGRGMGAEAAAAAIAAEAEATEMQEEMEGAVEEKLKSGAGEERSAGVPASDAPDVAPHKGGAGPRSESESQPAPVATGLAAEAPKHQQSAPHQTSSPRDMADAAGKRPLSEVAGNTAAPSRQQPQKKLRTRMDERGREVMEVVWVDEAGREVPAPGAGDNLHLSAPPVKDPPAAAPSVPAHKAKGSERGNGPASAPHVAADPKGGKGASGGRSGGGGGRGGGVAAKSTAGADKKKGGQQGSIMSFFKKG